jgi:hypothetical protein
MVSYAINVKQLKNGFGSKNLKIHKNWGFSVHTLLKYTSTSG